MKVVYVVVTLQDVPFPVGVNVFDDKEKAEEFAERIRNQYNGNRVYVYGRVVE